MQRVNFSSIHALFKGVAPKHSEQSSIEGDFLKPRDGAQLQVLKERVVIL